jgi:hypothetical protein
VFEGLGHSDLVAAGTEYARVIKEWAEDLANKEWAEDLADKESSEDLAANNVKAVPTSGTEAPKFG